MQAAARFKDRRKHHLREKNIAGPTERSRMGGLSPAQARRAGAAFFDEDDA